MAPQPLSIEMYRLSQAIPSTPRPILGRTHSPIATAGAASSSDDDDSSSNSHSPHSPTTWPPNWAGFKSIWSGSSADDQLTDDWPPSPPADTLHLHVIKEFQVQSRAIAAEVVGKGARILKRMEQQTQCTIAAPRNHNLSFAVAGRTDNVAVAMRQLQARVEQVVSIQREREAKARPRHGQIVRHIAVPAQLVSPLVGSEGRRINKIATDSHCYILSPKEDRDAVFHIVGKVRDTTMAMCMIANAVQHDTGYSLWHLLEHCSFRRENGKPEEMLSPSDCRKVCGRPIHDPESNGIELLLGVPLEHDSFVY